MPAPAAAQAARDGRGRGHERVRPVVEIEQRPLPTDEEVVLWRGIFDDEAA